MEYLKISHVHIAAVKYILTHLEEQYGKVSPLKTSWGIVHDYLGMRLDFREKGKVKVMMYKHIQRILETTPVETDGLVDILDTNHLFQVR